MVQWTPRAKFLDNFHNKSELIHLHSSTFRRPYIAVEQCDNDADTSIVREGEVLAAASNCCDEINATLNVNVKVGVAFSQRSVSLEI